MGNSNKKTGKQEVTNRTFNIGNISGASSNTNLQKGESEPKKVLVPIKFKVHKKLIERFHSLKMGYAKKTKAFGLSNNEMFATMVQFLYYKYQDDKLLEACPNDFKEAIIKPGKRKSTTRTVTFENSDSIIFKIEEQIADKYMDVMFSYIRNDKNDNIFATHHSRTYFFYDFIYSLEQNKTELFSFSIE